MPLRHPVGMPVNPTRFGAALFFALFTLAVAPGLVRAAAAEAIETRIERHGEYVTVNASALMQVDARIAWEVLSDYDNLAQFIPDMKSSASFRAAGTASKWSRRASLDSSSTGNPSTCCSRCSRCRRTGST